MQITPKLLREVQARKEAAMSKLTLKDYSIPKKKDIAVILVFFNPADSIRIQQNILYVKHTLQKAHIPVFIGEIVFTDKTPLFTESEDTFIFRSTSFMFYKEHLINKVISQPIVHNYSKYVILDADIIFSDIEWVDKVSDALDTHDVIQPFEYASKLTKQFIEYGTLQSICINRLKGHPGYAWAFTRAWYDRIGGLFEYAVIGGGDRILSSMAIQGLSIEKFYSNETISLLSDTKTGYLPGIIVYHLPHGPDTKRQYDTRYAKIGKIMQQFGIQKISSAIEKNNHGVFEWKQEYRNQMNQVFLQYFMNREDDNFD